MILSLLRCPYFRWIFFKQFFSLAMLLNWYLALFIYLFIYCHTENNEANPVQIIKTFFVALTQLK